MVNKDFVFDENWMKNGISIYKCCNYEKVNDTRKNSRTMLMVFWKDG